MRLSDFPFERRPFHPLTLGAILNDDLASNRADWSEKVTKLVLGHSNGLPKRFQVQQLRNGSYGESSKHLDANRTTHFPAGNHGTPYPFHGTPRVFYRKTGVQTPDRRFIRASRPSSPLRPGLRRSLRRLRHGIQSTRLGAAELEDQSDAARHHAG